MAVCIMEVQYILSCIGRAKESAKLSFNSEKGKLGSKVEMTSLLKKE